MITHFTELDRAKLFLLYHLNPAHPKAPPAPKGPLLQIVIIRHGEKPTEGDNLSAQGLERALALPDVLNSLLPRPPISPTCRASAPIRRKQPGCG